MAAPTSPPVRERPVAALLHARGRGRARQPRWPRRGALPAALLLLLLAVVAAGSAVARRDAASKATDPTARPATSSRTTAPRSQTAAVVITGHGYRLERPPGWQDRTADLGGRFGRVRADLVLTSGVTDGFAATITVIRAKRGGRQVPLTQLPRLVGAEVAKVPQGRLVGTTHRTAVAGESAVIYDFAFPAGGSLVRGRQVVVDRDGDRYFVTCEARPAVFVPTAAALAQVLHSWRWQ